MRIDKFLKVSRLIKRRTVADEACTNGHVSVNGKTVKSSYEVKEGDLLEISFGERKLRARVREVREHAPKDAAGEMYEVIG